MGPAVGWINGQKWQVESGRARFISQGHRDFLFIELWNEPRTFPCQEKRPTTLNIIMKTAPREAEMTLGQDPLTNEPMIVFIDLKQPLFRMDNMVADSGFLAIDILGATVTGRFSGVFSHPEIPRTEVSGSFTVPFCEPI